MKREKERYLEIDYLKAFAALQVILIHVLAYYRRDSSGMYMFWDLIHFAVGNFVIVSGFLQVNSNFTISSIKDAGIFLLKKFNRIVIPYYIFALVFILATVLLGDRNLLDYMKPQTLINTFILWGGVGNNWIPRLFMSLMVIVLLEKVLSRWIKWIRPLFFSMAIAGSIYLVTRDLDWMSKFHNLPGWLTIFYVGQYIYKYRSIKNLAILGLFSGTVAFFLYTMMSRMGLDTGMFSNKWPPDIYFVSYNVALSSVTWIAMILISKAFASKLLWNKMISFLSSAAYEVFFYHLIIIELYRPKINWFVDWVLVTVVTLLLIVVVRFAQSKITSGVARIYSGRRTDLALSK